MKFKINECISLNEKFNIEFKISKEAGTSFAQLTGDRSSLHVNSIFATTSAYRENIAHGMLPILFIAAIPFNLKQGSFSISKSRISFFNPIFLVRKLLYRVAHHLSYKNSNVKMFVKIILTNQ